MLRQYLSFIALAAISFLGFAVTAEAQFLPYRRMAKAAASDESVISQARSQVIETEWKANLVAAQRLKGLQLKTFVLMQRGFVVGFVNSQEQQNEIRKLSSSMPLRSLDFYLPIRDKTSQASTANLESQGPENQTPAVLVKMRIKATLLQKGLKEPLKVDVVVLNNTAVLIGIVDDERERETVLETAKSTKPIRRAVDFLLLPEPGYEKLLRLRQMSGGNRPSDDTSCVGRSSIYLTGGADQKNSSPI
jgi:osmotically-inducible protein OsmY